MRLCKTCNKELPKNRKVYCSNKCKQHERKELFCKVCGKLIPIKRKRRTMYCSDECHQVSCKGSGNPMYGKVSAMKGKPGAMLGKKHKISTLNKMIVSQKIAAKNETPEHKANRIAKTLNSKKNNHTFNTSKAEEFVYEVLNKNNIVSIRQYIDKARYPFACDFYLPKKDLFIECQFSWLHGKDQFDADNPNHIKKLNFWLEKSKNSIFYKNAIDIWTVRDPIKRKAAKTHNLNYLEFFDTDQFLDWSKELINARLPV